MTKSPDDDRDSVHPQFRSKPQPEGGPDVHQEPHPFFRQTGPKPSPSIAEIIDKEYEERHARGATERDANRGGWVHDVESARTQTGQKGR